MGLAASQARLLVLTARKSDLEFRAQNIANRKLLLSAQTENIATEYSRKLSNRQMRFVYNYDGNQMQDINEIFSIDSVYSQNAAFIGQYRVVLPDGRIAVPDASYIPGIANLTDANGVVSSGVSQPQSLAAMFASLSKSQQLSFFAQGILAMCSSTTLPEGINAILNQKVDANGNSVFKCSEVIDEMLKGIYGDKDRAEGITAADLTNLSVANREMIKSLVKDSGITDLTMSSTEFPEDATDEHYAAAINKINTYLRNNAAGNDFLNRDVSASSFPSAATSTQTLKDFLNNLAKNYQAHEKSGTLESTALTSSSTSGPEVYAAMNKVMMSMLSQVDTSSNTSLAVFIAANYSDFGAYGTSSQCAVIAGDVGTDGSQTIVVGSEKYVIIPGLRNTDFFQNALREGSILLEKFKPDETGVGSWQTENWAASSVIQDKLYTEDDAAAEAEYDTQTAIIQRQDKMLDVELKQIETQQKACENEIDAVKKIMDKNIEKSFKYMS